jgi:hypothetical protein
MADYKYWYTHLVAVDCGLSIIRYKYVGSNHIARGVSPTKQNIGIALVLLVISLRSLVRKVAATCRN